MRGKPKEGEKEIYTGVPGNGRRKKMGGKRQAEIVRRIFWKVKLLGEEDGKKRERNPAAGIPRHSGARRRRTIINSFARSEKCRAKAFTTGFMDAAAGQTTEQVTIRSW